MLTITRANVESMLVMRCGPWMEKAKMAVTIDGANASLNDSIRQALNLMGLATDDPTLVDDEDVARLDADERLDEFLDRAELRTLQTIHRRLKNPRIKVGEITLYDPDVAAQVAESIRMLAAQVEADWGRAGGRAGTLTLDTLAFEEI